MEFNIDIEDIITFVSGAALWEAFKFFFPDIRNYLHKRQKAKVIFNESLDLLIKASEELFGKLESLAKEDFSTFINIKHSNSSDPSHNQIYVCYLISQHWSALENIRLQSNYTSISRLKRGRQLLAFIETFESRKFRLLDRSKQRIIAEAMVLNASNGFQILPLYSFFEKVSIDKQFNKWIEELRTLLASAKNTEIRQRILVYGVIVEAFLHHFDPKHKIARRRKIYTNKLRPESLKLIRNVLLNNYIFPEKTRLCLIWAPKGYCLFLRKGRSPWVTLFL